MDFLTVADKELQGIGPGDIEALLVSMGWRQFGGVPGVSRQWVYDQGKPTSVVVPADPQFEDYTLRLREVLNRIASVYPRRPESLLLEIELPGSDELTNRKDIPSLGGSINWNAGESQIVGFRKTLAASAKATAVKQRQYGHSQPRIAREFLSELRMGHTRPGSFIITALSPSGALPTTDVKKNNYESSFGITGRQVVQTLTGSLETLRTATDEFLRKDREQIFDATVADGVSVDLLRGLVENLGNAEGSEVTVDWNPRILPTDGILTTKIVFEAKHRAALKIAQKRLQKLSKSQTVTVLGRITNLDRKDPQSPGVVTVDVIDGADARTVRIRLDDEYNRTGASHFRGSLIEVEGTLDQENTQYWITQITRLALRDARGNTTTIIGPEVKPIEPQGSQLNLADTDGETPSNPSE